MTTTLERPLTRPQPTRLVTFGPNWFASVMGTGIVATAAASLPHQVRGLHSFALCVWVLAAVMLIAITVATVAHWVLQPAQARSYLSDRVAGHFYGAPAMALLTVGSGTVLLGRDLMGLNAALTVDWVLWILGTAGGLATTVLIPYQALRRHDYRLDSAFGGWLMPVVPPMVSATTGALLAVHLSPGQPRQVLVALCYGMVGLSLAASVIVISLIFRRLSRYGVGAAAAVPTLWIVLGPVGQSIAAVNGLAEVARSGAGLALVYGLVAWTVALLWLGTVLAITVRTARSGLPFSLTWWSFTFPVGTVVLGTSALAARTGLGLFGWAAVVLYAGLVAVWAVDLIRTARNAKRLLGVSAPPAPMSEADRRQVEPAQVVEVGRHVRGML